MHTDATTAPASCSAASAAGSGPSHWSRTPGGGVQPAAAGDDDQRGARRRRPARRPPRITRPWAECTVGRARPGARRAWGSRRRSRISRGAMASRSSKPSKTTTSVRGRVLCSSHAAIVRPGRADWQVAEMPCIVRFMPTTARLAVPTGSSRWPWTAWCCWIWRRRPTSSATAARPTTPSRSRACAPARCAARRASRSWPPPASRRSGHADTIVVPGIGADSTPRGSRQAAEAVARAHRAGARVMSICTGAFVLAEAGVLDGRRATTHWDSTERLARRYPRVSVDPSVLYVDEGSVLTSAGVAAGLDLCLHVIRRDHGAALAAQHRPADRDRPTPRRGPGPVRGPPDRR